MCHFLEIDPKPLKLSLSKDKMVTTLMASRALEKEDDPYKTMEFLPKKKVFFPVSKISTSTGLGRSRSRTMDLKVIGKEKEN